MIKYRSDIDGLRAFAVIAVIIFHLGFLPNGYLGVDIFFIISGYLITSIVYNEIIEKKFSLYKFYERRIRRIIPLLLFITTLAFIIGMFLMLPDDLENLAQSVIASNFSVNNILMLITSADYWATKNEYKPLMHTWSLGIEEQYYLIYPFILLFISRINVKYIKHFLLLVSLCSLILFLYFGNTASRFYLLQYRFFELSIGGLFAVLLFNKTIGGKWLKFVFYLSTSALFLLLFLPHFSNQYLVILTTIFTVFILSTGQFLHQTDFISKFLFQNKIVIYLGKISFSLYLWHQLIFAFSRYSIIEVVGLKESLILITLTVLFSILSYHVIENPFRNKNFLSTRKVFLVLGSVFLITSASAFYIYMIGGVYKDFDVIGLNREDIANQGYNLFSSTENIHIHYNETVRRLDKDFEANKKIKVLIIGNSYGRDVCNIFLESARASQIDLKYFDIARAKKDQRIAERWLKADIVIIAAKIFISKEWIAEIGSTFNFNINFDKVICFGTKDYGYSNGIHYNRISSISDYSTYFANMREGTIEIEEELQKEWGTHYISLIKPVLNENGAIRIFTDNGKFISQDTLHLTTAGAIFYSFLLENEIRKILSI